ncbi:sensor histidine kinase [Taibaiella soli]|uniref:histidine kinase n=1 Tax=Taibaiella soli TaxID=1649169 RepID=A0A2W2ADI8_9BACT|nr:HAMP domain-containing sensor histidine kinase [Taibaiella soli]PZF73321.1 two-component sensor histidine kinase [Taibaiella soli]
MTIQIKTTVLFTVLTAGFIFLVSMVVYFFSSKFAFQDFYKRLEIRAHIVASALLENDKTNTAVYEAIREQYLEKLNQEKEYLLPVKNGVVDQKAADSMGINPSFLKKIISLHEANYNQHGLYYSGVLHANNNGNYIVVISARNDYGDEVLRNLRQILLACGVVSTLIVFTIGLFFSKAIFLPIRNIISRVKEISIGSLHLRLPEQKEHDEIAVLTRTFNDLLSRLEAAFDIQKNFVSNASHELRTPLTAIIGEADLALYKERNPAEYKASLEVILHEAEILQNLTNNLLTLAQTDSAAASLQMEPVRLDEVLNDIKLMVSKMHPEYQLTLTMPDVHGYMDAPYANGNYALLRLAISNVVLNAFKYSGKPVSILLQTENKKHTISISDEGIGIPEEELKYIFVPFFRASNIGTIEGHGIGLPLTFNIVRFHEGEIKVQSAVGVGTKVAIVLPVCRPYN